LADTTIPIDAIAIITAA